MKIIIQRVQKASVNIDNKEYSSINQGLLVLLGITHDDTSENIDYLIKKLTNLRIFNDENGVMNLSVKDVNGEILLVSQFTLYANTKKGNRPSYVNAAKPDVAVPLYNEFIKKLDNSISTQVKTGVFGADMKINLINDGPVTIEIEKN